MIVVKKYFQVCQSGVCWNRRVERSVCDPARSNDVWPCRTHLNLRRCLIGPKRGYQARLMLVRQSNRRLHFQHIWPWALSTTSRGCGKRLLRAAKSWIDTYHLHPGCDNAYQPYTRLNNPRFISRRHNITCGGEAEGFIISRPCPRCCIDFMFQRIFWNYIFLTALFSTTIVQTVHNSKWDILIENEERNLLQFLSSDPSWQSSSPSQRQARVIQRPLSHPNWALEHSANNKS